MRRLRRIFSRQFLSAMLILACVAPAWLLSRNEFDRRFPTKTSEVAGDRLISSTTAMLDKPIAKFDADDEPLGKVLERLAKMTGANIEPRWSVNAEYPEVCAAFPITAHLRNCTLAQALSTVLNPDDRPQDHLFLAGDGVILVDINQRFKMAAPGESASAYNVRDLLKGDVRAPNEQPGTMETLIYRAINRELYGKDSGNPSYNLDIIAGLLLVRDTPANQEKIKRALAELRSRNSHPTTTAPS